MNVKKVLFFGASIVILVATYFLALKFAQLLGIEKTVFRSMTGMSPDIRGDILVLTVFILLVLVGIIKFYEKFITKEK